MSKLEEPIRILFTRSSRPFMQGLCLLIASGVTFGPRQPLIFHLLDIPSRASVVEGMRMELLDMIYPLLREVITTSDPFVAFQNVNVAFLCGGDPRSLSMTRREIVEDNVRLFKDYGLCLDALARKDCKVMIVAAAPHTMAYICLQHAPTLRPENFTTMTRLDYNRSVALFADRLNVSTSAIKNIIIWGNDSESTYADLTIATVVIDNVTKSLNDIIHNEPNLYKELNDRVTKRSKEILRTREIPSTISSAKATSDQMHDWWCGTLPGQIVTMGVLSDGAFGAPKDIFISLPVEARRGNYIISRRRRLDAILKGRIDYAGRELLMEKSIAMAELDKDY